MPRNQVLMGSATLSLPDKHGSRSVPSTWRRYLALASRHAPCRGWRFVRPSYEVEGQSAEGCAGSFQGADGISPDNRQGDHCHSADIRAENDRARRLLRAKRREAEELIAATMAGAIPSGD